MGRESVAIVEKFDFGASALDVWHASCILNVHPSEPFEPSEHVLNEEYTCHRG